MVATEAKENWQRAEFEARSVHEVRAYTLLRNVHGRGNPCTQARWRGLAVFFACSLGSDYENRHVAAVV